MKNTNNFKTELHLPELDAMTERRLVEVRYHLIYFDVMSQLREQNIQYANDFVDWLGKIYGIDFKNAMTTFWYELSGRNDQPTKEEIIIACLYDGLSYEDIKHLYGFAPATISKYKRNFIQQQARYKSRMQEKDFELFEKVIGVFNKSLVMIGERAYVHRKKSRLKSNREKVNVE